MYVYCCRYTEKINLFYYPDIIWISITFSTFNTVGQWGGQMIFFSEASLVYAPELWVASWLLYFYLSWLGPSLDKKEEED